MTVTFVKYLQCIGKNRSFYGLFYGRVAFNKNYTIIKYCSIENGENNFMFHLWVTFFLMYVNQCIR
jgi:hypothetical protein